MLYACFPHNCTLWTGENILFWILGIGSNFFWHAMKFEHSCCTPWAKKLSVNYWQKTACNMLVKWTLNLLISILLLRKVNNRNLFTHTIPQISIVILLIKEVYQLYHKILKKIIWTKENYIFSISIIVRFNIIIDDVFTSVESQLDIFVKP